MNMGVGDAFDLGWKLAAMLKAYGGEGLLRSYEQERKPVSARNVERSGVHFGIHGQLKEFLSGGDPKRVDQSTEEGKKLRKEIQNYYQTHDNENKDFGIEMGYRYQSAVIVPDETSTEPDWSPRQYIPTTWPGSRPPHVFLADGKPIFDRFGKYWTLLSFSEEECGQSEFVKAAKKKGLPMEVVDLPNEALAKRLYERDLVLIRPDQHVCWRGNSIGSAEEAVRVVEIVSGKL